MAEKFVHEMSMDSSGYQLEFLESHEQNMNLDKNEDSFLDG